MSESVVSFRDCPIDIESKVYKNKIGWSSGDVVVSVRGMSRDVYDLNKKETRKTRVRNGRFSWSKGT